MSNQHAVLSPAADRSLKVRRALAVGAAAAVAVGSGTALAATPHHPAIKFAKAVKLAGNCGGEPSIDIDGRYVYVSAPKGILAGLASCDGEASDTRGVASWVSTDGGRTFSKKISVGSTDAGGDSDTTVGGHDVYVADLAGSSSVVCVSHDHGRSYVSAQANEQCSSDSGETVTGHTGWDADREWLNVYGPTQSYPHRDVFLSYHDLTLGVPVVYRSQDGGPFEPLSVPGSSNPTFMSQVANGTIISKPVVDRAGHMYSLVTTESAGQGPLTQLWLIKTVDHGATWSATPIFQGPNNANMGLVFNDLAMDGAGNLYALSLGNTGGSVPPVHAYLWRSTNGGASWRGPVDINAGGKAVALAAMHGGPRAGQLVIGWYHSTNTKDPNDTRGQWVYDALESSNATSAHPRFATTVLGATEQAHGIVHQGQICTQGILCTTGQVTGILPGGDAGQGNRNLADFSSVTVDSHGCAIFTYADDGAIKPDQSNFDYPLVNNDVTRQTAGCFSTRR